MLSNYLILCHPLLLFTSVFLSIRVISSESALCIRWPPSIGASASASVLPMNTQGWFLLGLVGWISLLSEGLHHNLKASILQCSAFFMIQLSHSYMTTGKTIAFTTWRFLAKCCLCFSICCSYFQYEVYHSFPPKEQGSFNFMAAVTIHSDFGAQENKICHCFHFYPFYLPWSDGTRCHDLSFIFVIYFFIEG